MPLRDPGDSAEVRRTFDESSGSLHLSQAVLRFGVGRSGTRRPGGDEVLLVVQGEGTLLLGGEAHAVEPEMAAYVPSGGEWRIESPGPADLVVVSVRFRPSEGGAPAVVRLSAADAKAATGGREFRLLAGPDVGCEAVTQFVGYIPPGRAPDHYHHYDEVIYVLDGPGALHIGGEEAELRPGSCIHLPARLVHSLENRGESELRVLGVFTPAGSPAEAYYPDGTLAYPVG